MLPICSSNQEDFLAELKSLEKIYDSFPPVSLPKSRPRRELECERTAFVLNVSDDEAEEDEDERTAFVLNVSDDEAEEDEAEEDEDDDEEDCGNGLVAVSQFCCCQLYISDDFVSELERASAFDRRVKYMMAREEADKKLHMQYQRKLAEALNNHIAAIQQD